MRILIIRPSAIGDVVMASLVLPNLKRLFPGCEIHWLIEPGLNGLLEENPLVDHIVPWDKFVWKKQIKGLRLLTLSRQLLKFRRDLIEMNYQLALDLQGLFRSRFLAFLSGAPRRVGFTSKEPGGPLMTHMMTKGQKSSLMGSEYIHMMRVLGLEEVEPYPFVVLPKKAWKGACHIMKELGIRGDFAVIAPFTTRPQKHWIQARWVRLLASLGERLNLPFLILGGPKDAQDADLMAKQAKGLGTNVVNLAGRLELVESAAMVSKASLVVGVDTGITHMGTAFKRPTVALFGATRPYLTTPSPKTIVLYKKLGCSPCRRRPTCSMEFSCMKAIETPEVVDAAARVLGA